MRFVTSKNAGSPSITIHLASMPDATTYPSRACNSSATPPPSAVEFTCHHVWPSRPSAASASALR